MSFKPILQQYGAASKIIYLTVTAWYMVFFCLFPFVFGPYQSMLHYVTCSFNSGFAHFIFAFVVYKCVVLR